MTPRVAIVVFPGSNCEQDVLQAFACLGIRAEYVWHHVTDLGGFDAVVLPGGFSYGDYLRTGAIAAFSPVMDAVREYADDGGLVIGICNGFQILCEAGLLPGALRFNAGLKFICRPVKVRVETCDSPFTSQARPGEIFEIPINHFQGNYYCPPEVLAALTAEHRIAFRYEGNPNGSAGDVAGVLSEGRNVLGMMPHPERAVDPAVGGTDGRIIFKSMMAAARGIRVRAVR
ncbi:MAG TPA: phosphoribosylformylglycinamidine synthase subunit PurQ [Actinomycetota bacterium]|nr:phosphoribosylformylglycinamidine synthase subunit PurQ [Actinomycetota bacterium]